MKEIILECKNISKTFGITKALQNVDFALEKGSICGLIGENGSGKSTLSNIISAIYYCEDGGTMILDGKEYNPKATLDAISNGVNIIVQEMGTVPNITVAHNIFLGRYKEFSRFGFIDERKMNREADTILESIGINNIKGHMLTASLNMQQRKMVEIAKAMSSDVKVLIIDETSNVLSEEGRNILFNLIHRLSSEGKSVIMISHSIEEVIEHCDNIVILRDGKISGTLTKEEFDADKIKKLMIGRELKGSFYRDDNDPYEEEISLSMKNASSLFDVTNVSLELHKGEILGIGGLADSGMHTIGKMLFGAERLARGEVLRNGVKITSPSVAVDNGIAYISKDRDNESLAINASIKENIAISGLHKNTKGLFYSLKKEKEYVSTQMKNLKIKANSSNDSVSSLSGGNKQKVAFAKWFAKDCDVYLMDCPTRGIDIGVKQEIYQMMYKLKKEGKSIILIGEEMAELIGMSDRVIVMKEGRIAGEFLRSDNLTEDKIINCMF